MAKIYGNDTAVYQISRFLGLNESPDGDTELKLGEASEMRNFRVTREGSLQVRPGYAARCTLAADSPVRGLWYGLVNGARHLLCACGGHIWNVNPADWSAVDLGTAADGETAFFGFGGKVYILDGTDYRVWTGSGPVSRVEGYVPLVAAATPPVGGGTLLEDVNLLTGKRRQRFSPDGSAQTFRLAEQNITSVDSVKENGVAVGGYTADLANGTVTFAAVPAAGTDTVEIAWTKGSGERTAVTAMRFAELFSGTTDNRVFLYGDGSNRTVYSGLEESGLPSAEYFPALNRIDVGSANEPLTGLIRHYASLLAFQPGSAWSIRYTALTDSGGLTRAGFFLTPVNREVGNQAPGQVRLVENEPWSLCRDAVYRWKSGGGYYTDDERHAVRESDRAADRYAAFTPEDCVTFDNREEQELYLLCNGSALVYHYGNDLWYFYDHLPARQMVSVEGRLCFGTADGRIMEMSRDFRSDDGAKIDAFWKSGAMAFGKPWSRKTSSEVFVAMRPESRAACQVTARSNLRADYPVRVAATGLSTMRQANFGHWSFATNRRAKVSRAVLRIRRFIYYHLIFRSDSASSTATILGADLTVRPSGTVR